MSELWGDGSHRNRAVVQVGVSVSGDLPYVRHVYYRIASMAPIYLCGVGAGLLPCIVLQFVRSVGSGYTRGRGGRWRERGDISANLRLLLCAVPSSAHTRAMRDSQCQFGSMGDCSQCTHTSWVGSLHSKMFPENTYLR